MAHLKKKISGCFEIRRDCDSGTACVNASLPEIVLQSVEKKELEKIRYNNSRFDHFQIPMGTKKHLTKESLKERARDSLKR